MGRSFHRLTARVQASLSCKVWRIPIGPEATLRWLTRAVTVLRQPSARLRHLSVTTAADRMVARMKGATVANEAALR